MTTHIKCLIEGFLKEKKREICYKKKIEKAICKFLSKKDEKHIKSKKIIKDQLVIYFDSSSFAYNFNLKKNNLLTEIKKEFPEIKGIKIGAG